MRPLRLRTRSLIAFSLSASGTLTSVVCKACGTRIGIEPYLPFLDFARLAAGVQTWRTPFAN